LESEKWKIGFKAVAFTFNLYQFVKVMSAVEHKHPGFFLDGENLKVGLCTLNPVDP
jgi:hypothetical protein